MVQQAADVVLETLSKAVTPGLPMVHLSHVYPDGASLYFTFFFRVGATFEETMNCWRALKEAGCKAILSVGGTISHQHGVGADHLPYLKAEKGELGMDVLKSVQKFLDPSNMMNPGKLI
jgi:alkyldihydroxyacetonephosphate synthase